VKNVLKVRQVGPG